LSIFNQLVVIVANFVLMSVFCVTIKAGSVHSRSTSCAENTYQL